MPGPDYKVQGWFFISESTVCASLAGVTVIDSAHLHWLHPPAIICYWWRKSTKVIVRVSNTGSHQLFFSFSLICRTVSTLLFSCSEMKSMMWPSESCDCIEMESETSRCSCKVFLFVGGAVTVAKQNKNPGRSVWFQGGPHSLSVELERRFGLLVWMRLSSTSTSSVLLFDRNVFTAA